MTNELSTTLEALAHLLDVHYIGTVVARSRRTDGRGVTEFDFTANTIDAGTRVARFMLSDSLGNFGGPAKKFKDPSWRIGTAETNHNGLYTHFNRAGERAHEAKSPTGGLVPPAIRLCYPLDLPIWVANATTSRSPAQNQRRPATSSTSRTHDSTQHGTLTMDAETGLLTRWITHRDNNSIADYELTSIIRPSHRPNSNDDGTITSISFDDKTNDA